MRADKPRFHEFIWNSYLISQSIAHFFVFVFFFSLVSELHECLIYGFVYRRLWHLELGIESRICVYGKMRSRSSFRMHFFSIWMFFIFVNIQTSASSIFIRIEITYYYYPNISTINNRQKLRQTLSGTHYTYFYTYINVFSAYLMSMRSSRVTKIVKKKSSQIQIEPNGITEHWHSTVSHTHKHPHRLRFLRNLGGKSEMERTQTVNAKNSFSRAEPPVLQWHTNENEQSSSYYFFFCFFISSILVGCRLWKEMSVVVTSVTVSKYVWGKSESEKKKTTGSLIRSWRRGQKNQTNWKAWKKQNAINFHLSRYPEFPPHFGARNKYNYNASFGIDLSTVYQQRYAYHALSWRRAWDIVWPERNPNRCRIIFLDLFKSSEYFFIRSKQSIE